MMIDRFALLVRLGLFVLGALLTLSAHAQRSPALGDSAAFSNRDLDERMRAMETQQRLETGMLDRLRQQYPATRFTSVAATPMPGIFEVVMGSSVGYMGMDARYMIFGRMVDISTNKDLTAERQEKASRIDIKNFENLDVIVPSPANTGPSVWIFSDPLCGYCRQLEATLAEMPNLKVHIILLAQQPGSREAARSVMCAKERGKAWNALMREGKTLPPTRDCSLDMIDRNAQTAARLGVQGTPTIVAVNGARLEGAVGRDELLRWARANNLYGR
jgi:thiol:disulfide interchange protein DsbC